MIFDFILDLNDFEVIEKIGEGSFGKVYLIKHNQTSKLYSAKITKFQIRFAQDQQLFFKELIAYSKINHPSVLSLYGINMMNFEDEYNPTLITEYMVNGSLDHIIHKTTCLTPIKKYIILYGVAEGMKYLHSEKIIHRDLKPSNVLLDQNLYPHICDFGQSKISNESITKLLNESYTGTPLYMAPEIFLGVPYTYKVDIFSFAILTYELLTNKSPYPEFKTPFNLHNAVRKGKRPDLSLINDEYIESLLNRWWSLDPLKRPNFENIINEIKDEKFLKGMKIEINEEIVKYLSLFEYNSSFIQEYYKKVEQVSTPIRSKLPKLNNKKSPSISTCNSTDETRINITRPINRRRKVIKASLMQSLSFDQEDSDRKNFKPIKPPIDLIKIQKDDDDSDDDKMIEILNQCLLDLTGMNEYSELNAKEYVYNRISLSIPEGLDINEPFLFNQVVELQILPNQEKISCLFSATEDINVFKNYCKYIKLSNVATFHFSRYCNEKKAITYFSFCTGKELITLVNPSTKHVKTAIKSLKNSFIVPCNIEDKKYLEWFINESLINRYASNELIRYINQKVNHFKFPKFKFKENNLSYSFFLYISSPSYINYLISCSVDDCENGIEPGYYYKYDRERCSIFDPNFNTYDLFGMNNVREIELAPNYYIKCVFSSTEDLVLKQYLSYLILDKAISFHFSSSPNGKAFYFTLCTGRDLIVFVNPTLDQCNIIINKIKNMYCIPCGYSDKGQLFFYDYLSKITKISSDSEAKQISKEINQVINSVYLSEFQYDNVSSYEKFLNIAYTTFLGYYIRSQYLESVIHPIDFKVYNIDDFIFLRILSNKKILSLNWKEGKVYILKEYLDKCKFNNSLNLYKTKRMNCIVPFIGEIRGSKNYFVFGFGSRGTLKEVIESNHLNIEICRKITIELVFAIAYLHMTGNKSCSINIDHISVCWDYHIFLTDFDDDDDNCIDSTPENTDIKNLGNVLYTLTTGKSFSSIDSKSISSIYGPIARIFELCQNSKITIYDIISIILHDEGFSQEIDFINNLYC